MAKVICKVCGAEMDLPNHGEMCIGAFNDTTDNVVGVLPTRLPNDKGDKRSMEMISKVDALKAAGFTEEQINKMIGIVGFNKDEVIQSDSISEQIYANRGAMNGVSFRRKITAQFLKAHFSYKGGVQEYINNKSYNWQFDMMLEECKQLMKMERNGDKEFEIRSKFFTLTVIKNVVEMYGKDLFEFITAKECKDNKKCKGVRYVKYIGLKDRGFYKNCCFTSDIYSRIISPLYHFKYRISQAKNYTEMYTALYKFVNSKEFIPLPHDYPKSKAWIDAFKGAGAYYSMMNLSQFSDLKIRNYKTRQILTKGEAREYLENMTYNSEGYELYGQFKQMLEDNNFNMDNFRVICKETKARRLAEMNK